MGKVAKDTVLAETLAEARIIAGRQRFWAGLFGAGVVIGLTGPFGTFDTLTVPLRVGYWLVVVATTVCLGYLTSFAVATGFEARGFGARLSLAFGVFAGSLVVAAWLAGLHAVVFHLPFWDEASRLFPYVVVIAAVLAVLSEAVEARDARPVSPETPATLPEWLDRLPARMGRELILLQAQDHYVRAETDLGDTLIRSTIQDAENALGTYGLRVHRSWWVARGAIKAYAYRNGTPVVVLQGGREVPVGRTYRRAVREAARSPSGVVR